MAERQHVTCLVLEPRAQLASCRAWWRSGVDEEGEGGEGWFY